MVVDRLPPPTPGDVSASYWRGVEDGRKIDRARAYRLGHVRGQRFALGVMHEVFGR